MPKAKKYQVIVESLFNGGKDHANFTISETPQWTYKNGEFNAKQIANYYAGEYCDSGTVVVKNTRNSADRAIVARRTIDS